MPSWLTFDNKFNFIITTPSSGNLEYDYLCMECANAYQTISYSKPVLIVLWDLCDGNPSTKAKTGITTSYTMDYEADGAPQQLTTNYHGQHDFFEDLTHGGSWDNFCAIAIESCQILESDCSTTFSNPLHIWFTTEKPLTLFAATDVEAGYSYAICIQCSNAQETVDTGAIGPIIVTQDPDCSDSLTSPGTPPNFVNEFSAGGADVSTWPDTALSWDIFFQNTETSACPITNCVFGNAGDCGVSSVIAGLTFSTTSPWEIYSSVSEVAGY